MTAKRVVSLGTAALVAVGGSYMVGGVVQSAGASAPAGAAEKVTASPAGRVGDDVFGSPVDVAPGANGIASATCPMGTRLSGGGGTTSAFDIFFTDSFRSGKRTWTIRGTNTGTTTQELRGFARCIQP